MISFEDKLISHLFNVLILICMYWENVLPSTRLLSTNPLMVERLVEECCICGM
jgi:hypothetical protein